MIITCPSCQTRFRLDPDRLGPTGARIRCSACKAVFRLLPSGAVTPDGAAERAPSPSGPGQPGGAAPARAARGAAAPADPFAPAGREPFAAADPFAADLGPDPFSLGAAATPPPVAPAAGLHAAAEAAGPPAERPSPPPPAPDPDALSLEEATAPPRGSAHPPPLPARTPAPTPSLSLADEATQLVEPRAGERVAEAAAEPQASVSLALDAPAPASPPVPAPEATPVPAPAAAPEEPGALTATASLPRLRRRTGAAALAANSLSLALLLALTAALLAWRGDLGGRVRGAIRSGARAVEPADVRAGLFDTAAGPAVLVVRGEVRARAGSPGPVRVKVALVQGSRTVATAEALAGAAASPEEVFAASTADQVASLRRALDERAVRRLAPGEPAPFLVLFPAPVPDLAGLQVRTAAESVPGP
ncbi:hypothetical protein AMYX_08340 [Anaeromyxobacter diazotrophicus]|uniref:Zinc finger/thioredoxin putative domain-containing protein n=2 Tax=Anaeromyxobacter diazotrophicus TaxID=2590199 RepID=A0A7I9VIC5_9BACT|nr:hypothetical protein AMYX_08340 [Anaeromyxobacter diazotrophicus]